MVKISKFGEDFLLLALRIDKHINGYVDFYFGPERLHKIVNNEVLLAPRRLLENSDNLIKHFSIQGYDKERETYIEKLLIAMKTSIELLKGSEIPFKNKFLRLYYVSLQPGNENELDDLKEEFNDVYRGSGSLEERLNEFRERRRIPESEVFSFFRKALNIVKNRTNKLFVDLLPKNESITIDLVGDKNTDDAKWAYYEWYLGNYTSRIEVNPNFNMYWSSLLSVAAHEGYPGHHTEFAAKEKYLYHKLSRFEHSLLLLNSPQLIISEGIAKMAINVLYSYRGQAEISLEEFCSNKKKEDPLDIIIKQYCVKRRIDSFLYNLAYHALIDEWKDEKLFQYATSFEIFSKEDIENRIKLLKNIIYSTTTFSYFIGSKLIMKKYGEFPSPKSFIELLIKPVLPSDLA